MVFFLFDALYVVIRGPRRTQRTWRDIHRQCDPVGESSHTKMNSGRPILNRINICYPMGRFQVLHLHVFGRGGGVVSSVRRLIEGFYALVVAVFAAVVGG